MYTNEFQLNVRQFDMKKITSDSIVALLGKRNSGKSFLVKDLLYHKRNIPAGIIISKTDHLTNFYSKFFPGMYIYKQYKPAIIDKLFKRQEIARKQQWKNPYSFLLFDDCLSDAKMWTKDEKIKEVFFNGRHYNILSIFTMQAPMGLPPDFRTNLDYTFILRNNNANDIEKIYKNYAGVFPTKEIFEKVLNSCTEDRHCLVIDNVTQSNRLEDQVFIYKASEHTNFKLCSEEVWRKNDQEFLNSNRDDNEKNTDEYTSKNNKKIIIRKQRK